MAQRSVFPIPRFITLTAVLATPLGAGAAERVSLANDGSEADSFSQEASVSEDGRFVTFQSAASNFAPGDEPPPMSTFGTAQADIFVFDTQTQTIELVSRGLDGAPANGNSDPSISGDGRYVAFVSSADNLVADDLNDAGDIFVYDRETQTLERINEGPGGEDADGLNDETAISFDGGAVAFESTAPNLVADDTNDLRDIFVWSRAGSIERVSVAQDGSEADGISDQPAISRDGRFVAFESNATNLVADDTNGRRDIFLVDRELGTIERIDVTADGTESDANSEHPSISADGRFVAFESRATNLVPDVLNGSNNIFVKDRATGAVSLISQSTDGVSADAFCEWPSISPDGQLVVFDCPATTLTSIDTGSRESVYLRDLRSGTTSLISTGVSDPSGNDRSFRPSMGIDAVAFASLATNLVADDNNGFEDIFVVRFNVFADGFEN
ncbi:MAG: hypothetical protein AAGA23_09290 [Pseudomonadota bacterium]